MNKQLSSMLFAMFAFTAAFAQPTPPSGKQWEKVESMSDEFNGNSINTDKWATTNATGWIGRSPGLFVDNTIKVENGNLKITNYKLNAPVVRNGQTFTHACGLVASKNPMLYGYFECKMKASKTFMSSTFWLINNRNQGNGCDKRVTELDIQETVGAQSGPNWVQNTMRGMNSNTHSRQTTCSSTPVGQKGDKKTLSDQAWQSYHTYGAWWKSKNEVLFYLDGVYAYSITPPANFDVPMYLRMVTETYDWNPVPADGGMTGSEDSRSTYYDWVHSYKLVDAITPPAGQLIANGTYTIESPSSNQRLLSRALENHNTTMHDPLNYNDQKWVFTHLGNDIYTIKNKGTNRFLEVPNAVCQNSTQVNTYSNASSTHQQWKVVQNGNGIYGFKPAHCLTQGLDRNNGTINTNVHTYSYSVNNGNQKWKIVTESGTSKIGTNSSTSELKINLYPNPANDFITIDGLEIGDKILITNIQGETLVEKTANNIEEKVSIGTFQAGIYLAIIQGKTQIKFVVR